MGGCLVGLLFLGLVAIAIYAIALFWIYIVLYPLVWILGLIAAGLWTAYDRWGPKPQIKHHSIIWRVKRERRRLKDKVTSLLEEASTQIEQNGYCSDVELESHPDEPIWRINLYGIRECSYSPPLIDYPSYYGIKIGCRGCEEYIYTIEIAIQPGGVLSTKGHRDTNMIPFLTLMRPHFVATKGIYPPASSPFVKKVFVESVKLDPQILKEYVDEWFNWIIKDNQDHWRFIIQNPHRPRQCIVPFQPRGTMSP